MQKLTPPRPFQEAAIKKALEARGLTIRTASTINQPDIEGFVATDSGVVHVCADIAKTDRDWTLVARTHDQIRQLSRTRALGMCDIVRITADDLDHLLAPYMGAGILRTPYERCTGATEYRGPSGRVIAVSIGDNHFARKEASLPMALFMQHVGRVTRTHPSVQPQ